MKILRRSFAILLAAIAFSACGSDGGDNANGSNQSLFDNSSDDSRDNSRDNSDDNEISDSDVEHLVDSYGGYLNFFHSSTAKQCQCQYEEQGYGSEQECVDDRVLSDSEQQELLDCTEEVFADQRAAPQLALDFFDCNQGVATDVLTCIDDVEADQGDLCSEAGQAGFDGCLSDFNNDLPACETALEQEDGDGRAQQWIDDVEPAIEAAGCLDTFAEVIQG